MLLCNDCGGLILVIFPTFSTVSFIELNKHICPSHISQSYRSATTQTTQCLRLRSWRRLTQVAVSQRSSVSLRLSPHTFGSGFCASYPIYWARCHVTKSSRHIAAWWIEFNQHQKATQTQHWLLLFDQLTSWT